MSTEKITGVNPEMEETAGAATVIEPTTDSVVDEVAAKLAELGIEDDKIVAAVKELGIECAADFADADKSDLVGAGIKPVQANKLLKSAAPQATHEVAAAPAATPPIMSAEIVSNILPDVPSDDSWLAMLKTGGILKVDQSTVIAAVRAALADRVGLYKIPKELVTEMEKFSEQSEEQVDPLFFEIRQQLTRRSYGDIFSAIKGMDGTYVTEQRKTKLLSRIDDNLWQAIGSSFQQLNAWQQSWMAGSANPMAFVTMMTNMLAGGGTMAPGMMAPPDTGALRDAGDDINNAINRVFAGTGVQIAAALAYEAGEIRKTLENPRLPSLIGVPNREQMMKKIKINVPSNYIRLETNLIKYILSFLSIDSIAAGDEEVRYFSALWTLGSQIDWNMLGMKGDINLTGLTGERL